MTLLISGLTDSRIPGILANRREAPVDESAFASGLVPVGTVMPSGE